MQEFQLLYMNVINDNQQFNSQIEFYTPVPLVYFMVKPTAKGYSC